ncbi:MAG: bifunctional riboflavin kinase/FAD synthetase [Armatimonadetes bacterium]|nr:bifunctional riboflavin kinase/FAD synthetase [Armatimonadota bacterium]
MLVQFGFKTLRAEWSESVVCIGTFDGVHLGHQQVVKRAIETAAAQELPSIVVTFDRHPAALLRPEAVPAALCSLDQKLLRFKELGASMVLILAFDHELAETTAADFLNHILVEKLRAKSLVVGHDFAMGKNRQGTAQWIAERIPTEIVPAFEIEGRRVSSSVIRELVHEANLPEAMKLLGHPFTIKGVVVRGQRLGRQLGFPTVNVARSADTVMPGFGVFAGWCVTPRGRYRAAISIGVRPTVGGESPTIEAFLIDYPGDSLYGQSVEIELWQKLREEERFESLEDLKVQMSKDVELARSV